MNKLISFGDSFTFGSELSDDNGTQTPSMFSWAALIAKKLNLDYKCEAWPGICNQTILRLLINYFATNDASNSAVAIMWSFTSRYEYHSLKENNWKQVSWPMVDTDADAKDYYKLIGDNEINELYTSCICFLTAQNILKTKSIPYVFTIADVSPFTRYFKSHPDLVPLYKLIDWDHWVWTDPPSKGFFEWGRKNFKSGKFLHPLDEAHEKFVEEIYPTVEKLIRFTN
jgi:hypothetical protein